MTYKNNKKNLSYELNSCIHHAALNPHQDISKLHEECDISKHFDLAGFCTHPIFIPAARERLGKNSKTKLISVISFPFGCLPSHLKKEEAEWAASKGAEEIDLAPNFFALNKHSEDQYAEEISQICEIGLPVRVIIDVANIPSENLTLAINLALEAGASGVQSGNGFGEAIKEENINQIFQLSKGRGSIKAVGGIKSIDHAVNLINAGASTIGTSFSHVLMNQLRILNQ